MRGPHARPAAFQPVRLVWTIICAGLKFTVKIGNAVINDLLRLFRRQRAIRYKLVSIQGTRRQMTGYGLVHCRLREHRLIAFIMAKTAITEEVENHVRTKRLPEFYGDT